jgi:hypothetical protein
MQQQAAIRVYAVVAQIIFARQAPFFYGCVQYDLPPSLVAPLAAGLVTGGVVIVAVVTALVLLYRRKRGLALACSPCCPSPGTLEQRDSHEEETDPDRSLGYERVIDYTKSTENTVPPGYDNRFDSETIKLGLQSTSSIYPPVRRYQPESTYDAGSAC